MKHLHFLCAMIVGCNLFGALVDPTAGVDPEAPVVALSTASSSTLISSEDEQNRDQRVSDIMRVPDDMRVGFRDDRGDISEEENLGFDGWHGGRRWGRGDNEDERGYDGQEGRWSDGSPRGMRGPRRWRGGRGQGFMLGRGRARGRNRAACCDDDDGQMPTRASLPRWHSQDDDQQPRNFRGRMERQDVMRIEGDGLPMYDMAVGMPFVPRVEPESAPIAIAVTSHVEPASPVSALPHPVIEAPVTAAQQATMAPVL